MRTKASGTGTGAGRNHKVEKIKSKVSKLAPDILNIGIPKFGTKSAKGRGHQIGKVSLKRLLFCSTNLLERPEW